MRRDIEKEIELDYDDSVDYEKVLEQFNETITNQDKPTRDKLLIEHGGLLSILCKLYYQRDIRNND